tara:strand:- start:191 stop:616 length:426 start_codon:yes stop_codon:yes gene_type:complete
MSGLSFLAILMQNCSDSSSYKIGTMEVKPHCHNAVFFIFKALYILAFTFVLNWFCSKKLTTLSWILVLLPFIGMFLILGAIMLAFMTGKGSGKEGFKEGVEEEDEEDEGVEEEEDEEDQEGFREGVDSDEESEEEEEEDED